MRYLAATYVNVIDGAQERIDVGERVATAEEKAEIRAALEAFLAGETEPLQVFPGGHADVAKRKTKEQQSERDEASGRLKHQTVPVPLTLAHVDAAKIRTALEDGSGIEELAGAPRFVRVVLDSGNKFDLPMAPAKKDEGDGDAGKGTKAAKK